MFIIVLIITIIVFLAIAAFLGKKHREQTLYKIAQFNYWRLRYTIAHEAIQDLQAIKNSTDLMKIFNLNKSLAESLELNSHCNLGPCPWGIFRTKDIKTMTPDEVFLGDTCGLFTKPLSYWNTCNSTMAGNGFGIDPKTTVKEIIFDQYYEHLLSNLRSIKTESLFEYQKYI